LENTGEKTEVQCYPGCISSDFERDIEPYIAQNEFTALESKLGMVRLEEFIESLGSSNLYIKEFYAPPTPR